MTLVMDDGKPRTDGGTNSDSSPSSSAVLIVAGSAANKKCLSGPRILPIGDLLELGRVSVEPFCLPLMDEQISRRHAQVIQTSTGYRIMDLGSTNGTYVDGVRIKDS